MTGVELWEPLPGGWPYQRSNRGRVRSLDRLTHGGRRTWRGRILKVQHPSGGRRAGGGGPRVTLSDGNRRATYYVRTGRLSCWRDHPRPAAESRSNASETSA
ncbi:NUMOD4 motif [Mycobacterium basiliense]|uniref:NUMOD4 motif n=1 Tax=Mycobacterium basiliense TaxID=2094119 RepID=A0A447G8Z2_9MYCO|nr:NUMOD4 motif [Mycobacterium basiliense]